MRRILLSLLLAFLVLSCGFFPSTIPQPMSRLAWIDTYPVERLGMPPPLSVNDPFYPKQKYLLQAKIPQAWQLTKGNPDIKIAVIDGEVALVPDLYKVPLMYRGSILAQTFHATPIAALIAAPMNDGVGMAGVTKCTLINEALTLSQYGYNPETMLDSISRAAREADIVNCSFGSPSYMKSMETAIRSSNAIFVASAMNESGSLPYYPAGFSSVIAVGSCTKTGALSLFSNFGKWVTLYAPGENLLAANEHGSHQEMTGTSFAAPLVTGTVGLMKAVNPKLSATEVKRILWQTADFTDAGKRLNAYRAVKLASLL